MSDVKDVLTDILSGGRAGARTVLHNCRFEGAGASAYGREAILDLFRAEAGAVEEVQVVRSHRFAALFASAASGPVALYADLYGEHIARLWYLSAAPLLARRPERVDVPFDPSFGTLAPRVGFDPADHPELAPGHVPRVAAVGACLLDAHRVADGIPMRSAARMTRPRPFVLRAFSEGETVAVLMQVVALRGDCRPGLVQFPIAAYLRSDLLGDSTVIVDEAECDAEFSRDWQTVL